MGLSTSFERASPFLLAATCDPKYTAQDDQDQQECSRQDQRSSRGGGGLEIEGFGYPGGKVKRSKHEVSPKLISIFISLLEN